MDGANHVDVDMHNKLKQKLSEEKKSELLMIQSGGLWTAHTLHKAGFLASSACPWCGGEKEDLDHLWWSCPSHEHHRTRIRQLVDDCSKLPKCLANHGIPLGPARDPAMPLWRFADCPGDLHEWDVDAEGELQGEDRVAWNIVQAELQQEASGLGIDLDTKDLTVRQLALWLHGGFDRLPDWVLEECEQVAPSDVTVYPDGGVEMGDKIWFGPGTWCIYLQDKPAVTFRRK